MNILVLGCSWSDDRFISKNIKTSWVKELSKIMPEHNFYNFSYTGSSVHHNLLIMESSLKFLDIKFDKIIFQITNEGRVTYYKNFDLKNIKNFIVKNSKNYFKLDLNKDENFHNICNINYGTLLYPYKNHKYGDEIYNFAKTYYSTLDIEHNFFLEFKVQVEYIKNKVDLMFLHKRITDSLYSFFNPNEDKIIIQEVLGDDKFKEFSIDEGSHFSHIGCIWEAMYIKSIIKEKWKI